MRGQEGKDRKIVVNHGNWERSCFKEVFFFLLQRKVGKELEMGKKSQANNEAGNNNGI